MRKHTFRPGVETLSGRECGAHGRGAKERPGGCYSAERIPSMSKFPIKNCEVRKENIEGGSGKKWKGWLYSKQI